MHSIPWYPLLVMHMAYPFWNGVILGPWTDVKEMLCPCNVFTCPPLVILGQFTKFTWLSDKDGSAITMYYCFWNLLWKCQNFCHGVYLYWNTLVPLHHYFLKMYGQNLILHDKWAIKSFSKVLCLEESRYCHLRYSGIVHTACACMGEVDDRDKIW